MSVRISNCAWVPLFDNCIMIYEAVYCNQHCNVYMDGCYVSGVPAVHYMQLGEKAVFILCMGIMYIHMSPQFGTTIIWEIFLLRNTPV